MIHSAVTITICFVTNFFVTPFIGSGNSKQQSTANCEEECNYKKSNKWKVPSLRIILAVSFGVIMSVIVVSFVVCHSLD
jgi:hypothetical protein